MANINKIRLSGQTYDIQDPNASKTVELTQAQYDALVSGGTVDPNTFYVITDAQGADLSNYYTKSETSGATQISTALNAKADTATTYTKTETDNAITAATSTKQDTLVSGTNIKTINNTSILGSGNIDIQGGGGKAVSGGTNISITTGETADTINCTLPIYNAGTSNLKYGSDNNTLKSDGNSSYNSIFGVNNTIDKYGSNYNFKCKFNTIFGEGNKLFVDDSIAILTYNFICGYQNSLSSKTETISSSFAIGLNNKGYRPQQALIGWYNQATNSKEVSIGTYNNSVSGSSTFGNSGNTLFSVGNGTADNSRHNAFEIRQNGDIYLSLNGQDVKLQDQLGGSSITVDTALDGSSTNPVENRVIYNKIDEVEQVTAAALNELNETLSGKADSNSVYTKTEANDLLDEKLDVSAYTPTDLSNYYTKSETSGATQISTAISKLATNEALLNVYERLDGSISFLDSETYRKYDTSGATELSTAFAAKQDVLSAGTSIDITNDVISVTGKVDTSAVTTSVTSASTDSEIPTAKAVYDAIPTGGGGSITVDTALDSGSTNPVENRVIYNKIDEVEQVTAAGINALNDNFGGLKLVKLSEAEYNALATKDSSTLYVIVG